MFISKKKQKAREQAAYELGLQNGRDATWQLRQMNIGAKGCIIAGSKLDKEIEEILGGKR